MVGMAARLPGAKDVETYWQRLRDGVESLIPFTTEELLARGVSPALVNDPHYVKAGMVFDGLEHFDAGFFGFSPREASLLKPHDPTHFERVLRARIAKPWHAMKDPA